MHVLYLLKFHGSKLRSGYKFDINLGDMIYLLLIQFHLSAKARFLISYYLLFFRR